MLAYRSEPKPKPVAQEEPAEVSALSAVAANAEISANRPEPAQTAALFQGARSRDLSARLRREVKFRCTFDEKRLFDRLARREGVSLSDFARSSLGLMGALMVALAKAPAAKQTAFWRAYTELMQDNQ